MKINYQHKYQLRSNADIFKLLILTYWKSIRVFKKIIIITFLFLVVTFFVRNKMLITSTIVGLILISLFIIGYLDIWIREKRYERESNLERAWVKERTLEFGDYGIIYNELGKHGLYILKFGWKRFKYVVEWEKYLVLIPADKNLKSFILRKDEFGIENFKKFKDFSVSKLEYRKIVSYNDLI